MTEIDSIDKYRTGILYNQLFNNNNNSTLLFLYLWFGVTSINVGIHKVEILIILKIRPLYGFAIFFIGIIYEKFQNEGY